ncbi:PhoX family phosphatase [Cyanobium sp. Morenito 9A2]|uniref:PhoX family protein n=1 Tax=Cyanobium sp. Morenito 9A2 TaxID=2823718 RepID=UPI0020CCB2A7|nr:alkaline phosphatase PhoX [Cyanobium sp. Morenito 9A2]MCP9848472.1 DUF839 domain-containing protein [Cyanobium sp. Morenito 9A2]
MNRRDLLNLLGVGSAMAAVPSLAKGSSKPRSGLPFQPVGTPLPTPEDGLSAAQQRRAYQLLNLEDRLVVPEGFRAEVLTAWGDPLDDGRIGFNNDYLAFADLGDGRGLLTMNFEYISARTWGEAFQVVVGTELPLKALAEQLQERGGKVDVSSLPPDASLRDLCRLVASAAMADLGIGVAELQRDASGSWRRRAGRCDRRITGLAGLNDPERRLAVSGPAAGVFRSRQRLGFDDGLGDRVIGTFANCAGGTTPWGTVLSAEENFQSQVVEAVHADGSSPFPGERPFAYDGQRLEGLGNPFALAGNKYGWMVELDPRHPEGVPIKHSWLGRFRHEAVATVARRGEPLIVYSGDDRHGGHLYRFVSRELIDDPTDHGNSRLFEAGRLEAARFKADGTGHWIPLEPGTPVDPQRPSHFTTHQLEQPTLVPHSDRSRAGAEALISDEAVNAYRQWFRHLGDLYLGNEEKRMGAILIDAHLAGNAVGATATARPEATVMDPTTGDLVIALTAGGSSEDGTADPAIFRGPGDQVSWPFGWVMRLSDEGASKGARFRWRMVATGGTPWQGGMGFSNPDNLAVDRSGNIWVLTDRSTKSESLDVFGNNSCWVLPRSGPAAGQALCFATGPMECELTGPCFDNAETTLFLSVQHPGEDNGTRREGAQEAQAHQLVDKDRVPFEQLRWVPLGSNWPSGVPGAHPRPAVVAIRRLAGGPLLG